MEQNLLESLHAAKAQLWVLIEKSIEEALDLRWESDVIGEGELFIDYCVFNLLLVSGIKRRQACHQLVKQCSKCVKINTVTVPTLQDHFWRHVLSTAAKTVSHFSGIKASLGKAKICNFDMSIMIDKQILRFEVSVDDVLLVDVHESVQNFNEVESSMFFAHALHRL